MSDNIPQKHNKLDLINFACVFKIELQCDPILMANLEYSILIIYVKIVNQYGLKLFKVSFKTFFGA